MNIFLFAKKEQSKNIFCGLAKCRRLGYRVDMLSVIIETQNQEEGLARTLSPLVTAVVEGLVREVVVCDRGSADGTLKVAEHAGCRVVGDLAEALRVAKADWLLFLEPGARPLGDWLDPLAAHMARQTMPAQFTRARESRPRLFAGVFATALSSGLLIRKSQALARLKAATGAEALARGLAMKRLSAELAVATAR